ncbi:hypothetical protein [Caballeronia sp. TF1N1]|uniref:hypothetical protein n=1 Tax=Caballeronia sp. TF1N1 TaxID=2878153 RepID=UPI001FD53CE6|nr:hypothetical protein [Caballeronia sp. TF1N1]
MGLFGSSSQTFVASSVYNLAGDIKDRPNFLKTTVLSGVIGNAGNSIAEAVTEGYKKGPGMTLRKFASWAKGSYAATVGFTAGDLSTGNRLDMASLAQQIPAGAGKTVAVQSADLGIADITWWAERYILAHKPQLIETNWHADYLMGQCYITYADRSVDVFVPDGFNPDAKYLFAAYTLNSGEVLGQQVAGAVTYLGSSGPWPSTDGWVLASAQFPSQKLQLTNGTVSVVQTIKTFERRTYLGIDPTNPARTHTKLEQMVQFDGLAPVGNQTTPDRHYQIFTTDVTDAVTGALQVMIYPQGGGNPALDAMFAVPTEFGNFLPYIPVRIDNKMVSPTYQPAVYAAAKTAYKRATGGRFDELVDKVNDNESIGDIDYCYVVFGVSVNAEEVTAKKYIYAFFEAIMDSASFTPRAYARFKAQWALAQASQEKYNAWVQSNGGLNTAATAAPQFVEFPTLPEQNITIKTSNPSNLNYNMKISWNGVEEKAGAGMQAGHAVGDMWWTVNGADTFTQNIRVANDNGTGLYVNSFQVPNVTLWWQVDDNNWKSLTIYGLKHQNMIYNGKSVDTGITDALKDTEESGFIIPLHEEIYREMPLKDATQMGTACVYLVFNSYQVVKKKWYQTGLFSVIMIVVIIVITIVTWGGGTGPAAAAYGAIGAAVGLTGTAAIIAGMAISMLAGMILSKVLGVVSKAIFGEKVGAIIGAVATVVAMVIGTSMANGSNWTTALSELTKPLNLLQLTNAVGQGVSEYIGYETQDIIKQTSDMLESYNEKMGNVEDAYQALGLTDLAQFNPMQLTDVGAGATAPHQYEPADSFLNRTLMTGSDIANLQNALISQFTSLTLDPNQNLVT